MAGWANDLDLSKEEDVKIYLDTLNTEYQFQCYSEKRTDGCHRLADFLEAFRKEFSKAREVYKLNCDEYKNGHSCYKLGNYRVLGRGGPKDLAGAGKAFKISCESDYGPGCYNLAQHYLNKKFDGKVEYDKAIPCLEKACDLKDWQSCRMLTEMFVFGNGDVKKDMDRAFKYATKGCDLQHAESCATLSVMYRRGDGVEKNRAMAEEFKKKAIDIVAQESGNTQRYTIG